MAGVSDVQHRPGYNRLSESVRKKTPAGVLCATFCGGRKCRYELSNSWALGKDAAIDGLYSHWVTNELLAMARPNTELIAKKNIIQQFEKLGIKSVINLQLAGEHAYCGPVPLTSSGFTYQPEVLMKNNIYYYNFGWKDYHHGSLDGLLDAVKVLSFALSQGKVAVHCHAGLGRTGVLLACFLVYGPGRWRADEAIRHVRLKRPNSLQTSGQLAIVRQFEHHLLAFSSHFASTRPSSIPGSFTLAQHLQDQRGILHGYEGRALRHIPKIIYVICERLLELCRADPCPTLNYSLEATRLPFSRSFYCARFDVERRLPYRSSTSDSIEDEPLKDDSRSQSLELDMEELDSTGNTELITAEKIISDLIFTSELPALHSEHQHLAKEKNTQILTATLWGWLDRLKEPFLSISDQEKVVESDGYLVGLDQGSRYTLEYILRFIVRLLGPSISSNPKLVPIFQRLTGYLVQQGVNIDGHCLPADRAQLDSTTLDKLVRQLDATLQLIRRHDIPSE